MKKYSSKVDPFIGVDGSGECICGPYLPFSIVRLSPDTSYSYSTNGYSSELPIRCFSHTHVSGTGGASRYGNIGITPYTGNITNPITGYDKEDEKAECGYYSVLLNPSKIKAELTSKPRVGIHRYTFPDESASNIQIDIGAVIQPSSIADGWPTSPGESTSRSVGGYAELISKNEVIGRGDFKGGWGHEYPYSVYFYAQFDTDFEDVLLTNNTGVLKRIITDGPNCKALINFGNKKVINIKVGISYVSVAQARAHVEKEAFDKDFETIRKEAAQIWDNALSRIRVEGGNEKQKTLFYTLFSRLLCMPSDLGVDDEYSYWKSGIRHFSDFYCLWDSVRNANSLIGLFDPELEVDFLNCILDVAEHRGWFPDAWISGHSAFIQGGSSVDVLFCEAAMKGLKGIDYEKALKYMRKNNELESPDPDYFGRHLKDYRDLGYVTTDVKLSCVSRHLEYAYQDWCIGALAEILGYRDIADNYYESSKKVWNLWREDVKSFGPKNSKGEWINPFDPKVSTSRYIWLDPYFYEGTSLQWSFNVQHDFYGLIERCGGPDGFYNRLENYFDEGHYHSKETMLHVPYLYIFAGRPDKTAERVRECMDKYFRTERNGLSDNEDMGCQSAFYMCSAMGVYPIMGQNLYLLTTPVFSNIEVDIGKTGKRLVIKTQNSGKKNIYVKSIKLNGEIINRFWIRHDEIADGAVLEFELSEKPEFNSNTELPPSPMKK